MKGGETAARRMEKREKEHGLEGGTGVLCVGDDETFSTTIRKGRIERHPLRARGTSRGRWRRGGCLGEGKSFQTEEEGRGEKKGREREGCQGREGRRRRRGKGKREYEPEKREKNINKGRRRTL